MKFSICRFFLPVLLDYRHLKKMEWMKDRQKEQDADSCRVDHVSWFHYQLQNFADLGNMGIFHGIKSTSVIVHITE